MSMENKKIVYIAVGIFVLLISISVGSFFFRTGSNDEIFTGGSGRLPVGYLVLRGYEVRSNQGSRAPLSMYLDAAQQSNLRTHLEVILYNHTPKESYIGNIVPGSADIDFTKNIIQFKVSIKDPQVNYTVQYKSLENKVDIYNEDGQLLDPTHDN